MTKWLILIAVCLFVLTGTALTSWYLYDNETQQIQAGFQRDISQRASNLEKELAKHRATLRYWSSFYQATGALKPEEFRTIAKDVLKNYPSLQLIGWAPLVTHNQRAAFEKQFKHLNPQFTISALRPEKSAIPTDAKGMQNNMLKFDPRQFFQRADDLPVYFPIAVVEPAETAGFVTGFNITAVEITTKQLEKARDTGEVYALPPIPSPFTQHYESILMALSPVYFGQTASVDERRNKLRGFIVAIFSIEGLVRASSLADAPKEIGLQLVDRTGGQGQRNIFNYGMKIDTTTAYQRPVSDALGRSWTIIASPSKSYIDSRRTVFPLAMMASGTLFTMLVLLYMHHMQRRNEVVRKLVNERTSELKRANLELEELSRVDSLTRVANRRHFNETLHREWRRSIRESASLAILLIDVDYFKRYNDRYGHLRGDECLQIVADELANVFKRPGDLLARYGGEEFAVILPNIDSDAVRVAERCRAAIEALALTHEASEITDHVTVSIGVSSVIPNESISAAYLLDCADKGLYVAKEFGRNKVMYHTCLTHPPVDGNDAVAAENKV